MSDLKPVTTETEAARLSQSPQPKQSYCAPRLEVIGTATRMVQGCGGSAGSDRNAYRIFCGGE